MHKYVCKCWLRVISELFKVGNCYSCHILKNIDCSKLFEFYNFIPAIQLEYLAIGLLEVWQPNLCRHK